MAHVRPGWGLLERVTISQQERDAFASAVHACLQEVYSHSGQRPTPTSRRSRRTTSTALRPSFTRRRITLRFESVFRARNGEMQQVAHYWLEVDAMSKRMMIREDSPPYGGNRP
jgi:hypothetical protein